MIRMPDLPLCRTIAFVLAAAWAGTTTGWAQPRRNVPEYELPPVNYSKATPNDAVTALQRRIAAGELAFKQSGRELLLEVLHALQVPVESQMLVFSKTSLQKELIGPALPRALYFSTDVYVGWVPGGAIEVMAIDPQLGPVFYNVKTPPGGAKTFARDASCMLCHGYFYARDIPGVIGLTVFPDREGNPITGSDFDVVSDTTRFEKRWGGWYVTGYTGKQPHRGNGIGSGKGKEMQFAPSDKRPAELSEFFDTTRYPLPTSEMAALLVFEHQMAVHNAITRLQQTLRLSLPGSEYPLVDLLLFRRSIALPEGIAKSPEFIKAFTADAKRSAAGDSLKDLALEGQLFRNRCSYLVYSEAFAALPESMQARIFAVVYEALHDPDPEQRYAYLAPDERKRIFDILMETHPAARRHFEKLAAERG